MNAKTGISKGVRKAEDATIGHARRFILDRWDNVYEARRNIGIWLSGVGLLIFIMVAHFIFLRSGYTDIAPIRGGTYAEGMVGDISTLNPIYATTASEIAASRLMFSSLFRYDDTGSLSGDLATGYNVDKTGKIYTVSLHQRALWHDNTPVTVDDVIFTLNIIKRSSSGAPNSEGWGLGNDFALYADAAFYVRRSDARRSSYTTVTTLRRIGRSSSRLPSNLSLSFQIQLDIVFL